jgi:hypothetical protein
MPDSIRHLRHFWIPAFAGMTALICIVAEVVIAITIDKRQSFLSKNLHSRQDMVLCRNNIDALVKSRKCPRIAILANPGSGSGTGAGIQTSSRRKPGTSKTLDTGFHRCDDPVYS